MAGVISHQALASSQSHWCRAKNSRFEKRAGSVRLVYVKGSCGSGSRKLGLVWASSSQSSVMEPMQLPSDGNSGHTPKKSSNFNDFHLNELVWLLLVCLFFCFEKIGHLPHLTLGFANMGHISSVNLLSLCRCR